MTQWYDELDRLSPKRARRRPAGRRAFSLVGRWRRRPPRHRALSPPRHLGRLRAGLAGVTALVLLVGGGWWFAPSLTAESTMVLAPAGTGAPPGPAAPAYAEPAGPLPGGPAGAPVARAAAGASRPSDGDGDRDRDTTGPERGGGGGPVSFGYYPGWVSYGPDEVDYRPWTHIGHFGVYPRADGGLHFGDLDRSDLAPAVRAAHANGTEIYLVIGSEGTREEFLGATRERHRAGFVRRIVGLAADHGYDGVDIAWSDRVDSDRFRALIRDLRAEIDAAAPGLGLSFTAVSGLLPPATAADLHRHVDFIHLMSYWSDGADELGRYTSAGVPAGTLTVGVGLYADYHDTTPARVADKVALAAQQGAAGVSTWSFQHLERGWSDPRLAPLRELAAG